MQVGKVSACIVSPVYHTVPLASIAVFGGAKQLLQVITDRAYLEDETRYRTVISVLKLF
jgi:hypothetical protein